MKVSVKTGQPSLDDTDALVLPLVGEPKSEKDEEKDGGRKGGAKRRTGRGSKSGGSRAIPLPAAMHTLDRALGAVVARALEAGDFRARSGQTAVLYPPTAPRRATGPQRVILVGLGAEDELTAESFRRAAGSAMQRSRSTGAKRISVVLPKQRGVAADAMAQAVTEGIVLGAYRFGRYQTRDEHTQPTTLTIWDERRNAPRLAEMRRAAAAGLVIAESQNLARDLSNEPGNELPPAGLAAAARALARKSGLRCQVMNETELKRRKMGGILAVGQGSARPPRLIVLEHGATSARTSRRPTICIVGKGITFDSGGISIKPAAGMEEMKHDMGGAAAVIGAMRAVALLDLPLHVVAVVASAENMPSGSAYRPGDIIRSHSGKTIEVLNTDAEGRVVLADALHYAVRKWKPAAIVDLATLTGACMVALGPWASGLLGNDEALVEKVRAAGEATGERAWPLPLFEEHRTAMRSDVADLKNTGGRNGGASTAAGFLAAFVGKTPWVHLDIAGTGWTSTQGPYQPKGGTGVGVRLVVELLRAWK